ncbi:MAG: preprotein translocase subunit SecA [Oscillospiraceae bacterium]|nr:preprotein translocase subunit SecA [Oscillospiraceae bacterium]
MSNKNVSIAKVKELAQSLTLSELKSQAQSVDCSDRVHYALAACYIACREGLRLVAFDEQLIAAYELFNDRVIQMNTGEGKTIAAIFAAYLKCVHSHKVHILTFNDYLAKRDCKWMKPIAELLGLKVGFLLENTARAERRELYKCDVLYSTVKEVGFDFLRDFTGDEVIQPPFDCVIVDEADSILIDEARLPLVISGDLPVYVDSRLSQVSEFVQTLSEEDYGISKEDVSAYLTNSGCSKTEQHFGVDNLYDSANIELLSAVCDCLKACFVLKKDIDYIIKDGQIKIVDEYTGRVAENRHYPGALQVALETLNFADGDSPDGNSVTGNSVDGNSVTGNSVTGDSPGVVMGIVPIQFFIRQYKSLSGMTGTASDSQEEFELLYGLSLKVIPARKPCVRKDHGLTVYYDNALKEKAIIEEIKIRHKTGQPILVGTESIEESERLSAILEDDGIEARVLNAKHDEHEADIIKNAGALNAVTISTNMAGRGVDIILGGANANTREPVTAAGGLCVISTGLRESSRINKQLIGRAGRQGDVGESLVFASLDQEIMTRGGLSKLLPGKRLPEYTAEKMSDKTLLREIERVQRIVEGDTLERRKQLLKFTAIGEKHRDATFSYRKKLLTGQATPDFWQSENPDLYEFAVKKHGERAIEKLQRELAAAAINEAWCDYLEYTSDLRRGIHLTKVGGKNPADEYNISSQKYYEQLEEQVPVLMTDYLIEIANIDDLSALKINKPSKTQTYLLDESVDELAKQPFLVNVLSEHIDEDEPEPEPEPKKPGLLSRLFGKKN